MMRNAALERQMHRSLMQADGNMRMFDAFSGIGGFRIGFEAEGFNVVGWSEIDKWASKLYSAYFNDRNNYGDITGINPDELPDFDVITAGVPCQPFSIAGKRRGLEDARGMPLWRGLFRIIGYKKPKIIVIENVKGLLSSNGGRDFGWVLLQLDELGYNAEWQVLNCKDFGVPQSRERVFIIGHLRGKGGRAIFPIREEDKVLYKKDGGGKLSTSSNYSPTIRAGYYKLGHTDPVLWYKDDNRWRRFTPLEAFRLNGFPDDIVATGRSIGISDTQLYKMAGNSVAVPIVRTIARKVKVSLF